MRKLFYKVKKAQGTDITRTFCGLNDIRNIAPSITYAHEAGMISQCSLCITHSPIHTVEYYTDMALKLIKLGADEICIKDMAGIGRPVSLGKIVANIKAAHPEIPVPSGRTTRELIYQYCDIGTESCPDTIKIILTDFLLHHRPHHLHYRHCRKLKFYPTLSKRP